MKTYQDFCKETTDQLFSIIGQKGSLLAWQKGWSTEGCALLPIGSNGMYRGANIIRLLMSQVSGGFSTNKWLTFNQIKKMNGNVKKGAKSNRVFFWQLIDTKKQAAHDDNVEKAPIFKTYNVFNIEQSTLDPEELAPAKFEEGSIDKILKALKVNVSHFGNKAYYNHRDDVIVLPHQKKFSDKANYCSTLLHELTHWTAGREDRCPRQSFKDYHTDIKARSEEELVAEIGSVLLSAHLGLKGELENHASYVRGWKNNLDEKQVMRAAHKAGKAFEWIINALDEYTTIQNNID